jgi:hypothetical protein
MPLEPLDDEVCNIVPVEPLESEPPPEELLRWLEDEVVVRVELLDVVAEIPLVDDAVSLDEPEVAPPDAAPADPDEPDAAEELDPCR